jgi:RNA polymerase sigma-70 factor, ECF subfamily
MQIVGDLSPSLRKAVQLRDFEEMSTSEAAEILGVPEGTIKSWVSRARLRLKRRAKIGMLVRP